MGTTPEPTKQNHCVEADQPLERPVSVERAYEFLSTVCDAADKSSGHAALRKLRRVDEIVCREPELFAHEGTLPRMRATYHEHHRSMPPATSMASIASSAHCRNHPAKSPVTPPKRDRATWRYHASAKSPATAIRHRRPERTRPSLRPKPQRKRKAARRSPRAS